MGSMSSNLSRRVVLGSIAGSLAGTVAVLQALKGRYGVNIPSNSSQPSASSSTVTSDGTVTVNGYTLKVPKVTMKIEKPEDWDTYRALCRDAAQKAIDNDPGYAAHLKVVAANGR